ncbi:reverse transcriptase, partial [Penaeus vannamei]
PWTPHCPRPCEDCPQGNVHTPGLAPAHLRRHVATGTSSALQRQDARTFAASQRLEAYHQIAIAKEDIPKTAAITPIGLFEFLRMPFGLRNSDQTFQRFIDDVTRGPESVFAYIDDILVASASEDHACHLRTLFRVVINPG